MFEMLTKHIREIRRAQARLEELEDPYDARFDELRAWTKDLRSSGLTDRDCVATLESYGVDVGGDLAFVDGSSMDYRAALALLTFLWRADRTNEIVMIDATRCGLLLDVLENLARLDAAAGHAA